MENSSIEWCNHTFNPWEGCTKVSPGCVHCYAEARNARFGGGAPPNWGKGAPRRRTSAENWKQPLRWNLHEARLTERFGSRTPTHRPRVFCASLADWLDDEVPIEWLADLLDVIRKTPHLDWLLLTKRPENWRDRVIAASVRMLRNVGEPGDEYSDEAYSFLKNWLLGNSPTNVWIGTTVEDQTRADQRIPQLLTIPAKVRFLSCEPLLEAVDLKEALKLDDRGRPLFSHPPVDHVDWVIVGGESGPHARPMHPDWARALRDQCEAAVVPFLFKQWGEWHPAIHEGKMKYVGYDNEFLDSPMQRLGKKKAGRLLDGREWNGFPLNDPAVALPPCAPN